MADMEVMERPPAATPAVPRRPELAGPRAPAKPLSFFAALRAMNDNPLATVPVAAYEQPIWQARSMFGNQLLVSDPAGIKRVLLDNVANYPKLALDVRILSTAFGDGLLTSDGDKWRAHRRVMSPSFDYRSIASYASLITDAAEVRLEAWDAKGENAEIDIAQDMAPVIGPILMNRKLARIRANFEAVDAVMQKLIRGREKRADTPNDLLDR